MKKLVALLIFITSVNFINGQEVVFGKVDLYSKHYKLLIINLTEAFKSDTTYTSYLLDGEAFRKISSLKLPMVTEEYHCAGSHNFYLMEDDSVIIEGNIITECGQIRIGKRKYAFTSEDLEYWFSLGKPLLKSHYVFKSLEEGRKFYNEHLKEDTSILSNNIFMPTWLRYDGWFSASIEDSKKEGLNRMLEKSRDKLKDEHVEVEYLAYYDIQISDPPNLDFKIYCDHSFYEKFIPKKYGLMDEKGKWRPARTFTINVFRRGR